MAEPTHSPSLPSTADTTPYVPVSWMAVAAIAVAGLFALLLLAFGAAAFTNKKPLLMEGLLALPVIAVVLEFRRGADDPQLGGYPHRREPRQRRVVDWRWCSACATSPICSASATP